MRLLLTLAVLAALSPPLRAGDPDKAAVAYASAMRQRVLPENFELRLSTVRIADRDEFSRATSDRDKFLAVVAAEVDKIAAARGAGDEARAAAGKQVAAAYVDKYDTEFLGAYALALWFMRFDADNWFSFEQVHAQAGPYLARRNNRPMELRLIKGFRNAGVLARAVTVADLPVVVNFDAQTVTIWWGVLND